MVNVARPNLGTLLRDVAVIRRNHAAFVSTGGRYSYSELWERSLSIARGLSALGVRKGDHVGILMPNNVEFAATVFGAAVLGAVVVPMNTRYQGSELAYVLRNADLAALCVMSAEGGDRDLIGRLHESLPGLASSEDPAHLVLAEAPRLRTIISFDPDSPATVIDRKRFEEGAVGVDAGALAAAADAIEPEDIAVICYTSGTSANPKGCMITNHAMVIGWVAGGERLGLHSEDRVWAPCPLYHLTSLGPLVYTIAKGATLVTQDYFEAESALRMLKAEKPTLWYTGIPPIANALFALPGYRQEDFPEARVMLNPGPRDVLAAIQQKFPGVAVSGYGMTEAAGLATVNDISDTLEQRITTTGRPVDGMEVRIVDPSSGRVVEVGEPGEIQFRGTVFDRYYANPEATAATKQPDGWVHSGDIGKLDEGGRVIYLSRMKDMLKVGGENVAPVEVEICLCTHPGVKLAQVVGFPDERLGEVPVAFIETHPGKEVSEQDLLDYCEIRLARFKRPRRFKFVTVWPESVTLGKIQKVALREILLEEQAAESVV